MNIDDICWSFSWKTKHTKCTALHRKTQTKSTASHSQDDDRDKSWGAAPKLSRQQWFWATVEAITFIPRQGRRRRWPRPSTAATDRLAQPVPRQEVQWFEVRGVTTPNLSTSTRSSTAYEEKLSPGKITYDNNCLSAQFLLSHLSRNFLCKGMAAKIDHIRGKSWLKLWPWLNGSDWRSFEAPSTIRHQRRGFNVKNLFFLLKGTHKTYPTRTRTVRAETCVAHL